jgi:hypothetical protein
MCFSHCLSLSIQLLEVLEGNNKTPAYLGRRSRVHAEDRFANELWKHAVHHTPRDSSSRVSAHVQQNATINAFRRRKIMTRRHFETLQDGRRRLSSSGKSEYNSIGGTSRAIYGRSGPRGVSWPRSISPRATKAKVSVEVIAFDIDTDLCALLAGFPIRP